MQLLALTEVVMRHAEADMAEHRARVRTHEKELERQKAKAEAEEKEKEKKAAEEAAAAAAPTPTEGDVSTEAAPASGPPAGTQETSAPQRMEGLPELRDVDEEEKNEGEKLDAAPIGPCEAETVLKELPAKELSYLCRLLAHQG